MMFRARFLLAATAVVAAAGVSAVACGDDDDEPAATPTQAAATAPAAAAAATTAGSPYAAPGSPSAPAAAASPSAPAAAASPSVPAAAAALIKTGTTSKGPALQDAAGLTLYTFDNDTTAGKSACNGNCAATWPPVTTTAAAVPPVAGASGQFTIITRDDGVKQIAYGGKPLYRFGADRAPGDVTGDGVGGVWHIAKP